MTDNTKTTTKRWRPPGGIKRRLTGDIRKLNARLLDVAVRLDQRARRHRVARTPNGRILCAFYRKAVNTFTAIELLKSKQLVEEAWVLLRVLLEVHVNFIYFLKNDPEEMCHRYLDASMLDKLKHLREVGFYEGTRFEQAESEWGRLEDEIKSRYSATEFKAIKRNGFTGLNFQERAESVGLKGMYQFCYRIASRSVHLFDPAETTLLKPSGSSERKSKAELLKARRAQLERNQNMLLGRISYLVADMIGSHALEVLAIGMGYEKYCDKHGHRVRGKEQDVASDEQEIMFVWRE